MKRIDRIDERIIGFLQKDARITNKDLAEQLGVSASTSLTRMRRLEEIGLFRGFHAEVEPRMMGVKLLAMIAVRLSKHDPMGVHHFKTAVLKLPEVRQLYHVAGDSDFFVHVAVRDSEHLRRLVLQGITSRPEVDHVETSLIFEHVRDPALPSMWEE
jgi:DNA-binding Lrp family transcriptional regulator